jgi:hypothetical protein
MTTTWTVVGYWDDAGHKIVVGVIAGACDVYGGEEVSEGGPFADQVQAPTWEAAQKLAESGGNDMDSDCPGRGE